MAQIIVRNLNEGVKRRLRERAASHGKSMEAEARDILGAALGDTETNQPGLGTRIAALFADIGLEEGEIVEWCGEPARAAEFEP